MFTGYFSELTDDELTMLIYAIVLEPEMRHKLGYAKPAGFGSIHIQLTSLQRQRTLDRYRMSPSAAEQLEGTDLDTFIGQSTEAYRRNRTSITLNDLRRIWRWPPAHVSYRYPSREWFSQHPSDPISKTP
jgi:hypothetical protein